MDVVSLGSEMHELCRELFPICRSITGDGFRTSLAILKRCVPSLKIIEVPSGTKCFDWTVPHEWNARDAYIITPGGDKICEFKKSNLHLLGYSTPVDKLISLDELQDHLFSLPDQPDAIPYVTSYYKENWGFCITHSERENLKPGTYKVFIDSDLSAGHLTMGELVIPGQSKEEVFISTYLCHPSMANNELSGPVVSIFLAQWLLSLTDRKYTYRIVFVPETIGAIAYLSRTYTELKNNVIAGFNLTCIGDDRAYSYLPSRKGDTLADQAAVHVLTHLHPEFITYSYLDRGSDERQYCSPGIDLPVCSIMRTKYGSYPEYHTSLDDLSVVTPEGLAGGYEVAKLAIECIEANEVLRTTVCCEPQLGKYGLYPTTSTKKSSVNAKRILNLLAYADGSLSAIELFQKIKAPMWEFKAVIAKLKQVGLLEAVEPSRNSTHRPRSALGMDW